MKEQRFLELVNIYLDGEISAAETAELEREIRSSSERMKLYRSYCRMQKACLQLAESHREATAGSVENVVQLPVRSRAIAWDQWWRGAAYAGTAMVAASVILVISMSGPGQPPAVTPSATISSQRIVQIPVGEFARPAAAGSHLAFMNNPWNSLVEREATAFPVSYSAQTPEFSKTTRVNDWNAAAALKTAGPIEFHYRSNGAEGGRVLQTRQRGGDAEVEFTTFQFAR